MTVELTAEEIATLDNCLAWRDVECDYWLEQQDDPDRYLLASIKKDERLMKQRIQALRQKIR